MSTTIHKQILILTDQILDKEEYWCKNNLTRITPDGTRQFCIRGAMNEASKRIGITPGGGYAWFNSNKTSVIADNILAEAHAGQSNYDHITWQNNPDTTFKQLKDLFRRAIKLA